MSKNFSDLLSRVSACKKKTLSVAVAQDKAVLEAVKAAKERGIADAILVGDEARINEIAAELGMDMDQRNGHGGSFPEGCTACTRRQSRHVYERASGHKDVLKECP